MQRHFAPHFFSSPGKWLDGVSLSFPPARTAFYCAAFSPAQTNAESSRNKQRQYPKEHKDIAFGQIINKTIGWDEDDGCKGRPHGDFGIDFFIILLSIKLNRQNWRQYHNPGADQPMKKSRGAKDEKPRRTDKKSSHSRNPDANQPIASF